MWLWWLGILCDGHPFTSDLGIILVTSPEFPKKIAQQKRHCRAKPTHTTHRGIVHVVLACFSSTSLTASPFKDNASTNALIVKTPALTCSTAFLACRCVRSDCSTTFLMFSCPARGTHLSTQTRNVLARLGPVFGRIGTYKGHRERSKKRRLRSFEIDFYPSAITRA